MELPYKVKVAFVGALLFGAIAVDFASKFMSITFDLFFIGAAIYMLLPMMKASKAKVE